MEVEQIFVLDSFFSLSKNETHVDYENKKIYFGGMYIYDNPEPIPDPRVP